MEGHEKGKKTFSRKIIGVFKTREIVMNKTVKQMLMRAPLMIGAGVFGAVLVNVINGKPISLKLIFFATIFMIVMTAIGLSVGYLLIGRTKDKKVVLRRQKKQIGRAHV